MVLTPMSSKNVGVAVVNAIGCGAFLETVHPRTSEKVRNIYAHALRMVLENPEKYLSFEGRMTLQAVVICFPAMDKLNFNAYEKAFERAPPNKHIDVYL